MQPTRESSLLHTACRFFMIGKFFGLSCYSIKRDISKGKYTAVTKYDLTILIGFLSSLIFLTYRNFVYPQNISINGKDNVIFNISAQFLIGGSSIICIAGILKAFFDREKLWTVFFEIRSIDNRMKKFGIVIDHILYNRHVSTYLFVCYSAFLLYISLFVTYLTTTLKESSISYIIVCVFVNGMMTVITNKFHLILAVLFIRFTLLNNFLLNLLKPTDNKKVKHVINSTPLLATIEEVTRSHELLNAAAIRTNYLFSSQMLGTILAIFGMTLFPIYEIYSNFLLNKPSKVPFLLICLITSAVFHNGMLFVLVLFSTMTKNASDYTAVIVHKAISKEFDKRIILQLKLLSQQILHRTPSFGCNVFSYDWPFVFTYIAAMTSYLIILMQFQSTFEIPKRG